MRLVDKQILRELAGPFLFGLTAFTSVFFAGSYLLKLTQWMMDGMPLLTAIQVVGLTMPGIITYTLPMAMLLAVLLGVGRLSSDSEVTALFAGGVSIYRLTRPIIIVGILVSGASILINEYVAPRAAWRNQQMLDLFLKKEARSEQSFTIIDEESQSLIKIDAIDPKTGDLRDVTVIQFSDKKPLAMVFAKRAEWEGLEDRRKRYSWKLHEGYTQELGTQARGGVAFSDTITRDIRKTPQELAQFQKKPEEMSFAELSRFVEYLKRNPVRSREKIRELDVKRWNKFALPFSSLVFAMLAAPLAIRPQRSSSSVGLGLSILLIFLYWMTWHYTSALAVQGGIDAPIGAFAADVLGIIAAIVLLKRAAK